MDNFLEMIKKILLRYSVKFKRENRLKILASLPILLFRECAWKFYKKIKGIEKPIVHVYAISWNEAKILPYMLKYYEQFVEHFYFYDNCSDDETDEILSRKKNVTVYKFDTGGEFNDVNHQKLKNKIWKRSRGKADWVIVIDTDEFLYHPDIIQKIKSMTNITIIKPLGYDMVSSAFPIENKVITNTVKKGVYTHWMDKSVLFNPHKIVEINYSAGAHECYPEGIVVFEKNTFKILHYKYLGTDYVLSRIRQYRKRLSATNIDADYGTHYLQEDITFEEKVNNYIKKAVPVI